VVVLGGSPLSVISPVMCLAAAWFPTASACKASEQLTSCAYTDTSYDYTDTSTALGRVVTC